MNALKDHLYNSLITVIKDVIVFEVLYKNLSTLDTLNKHAHVEINLKNIILYNTQGQVDTKALKLFMIDLETILKDQIYFKVGIYFTITNLNGSVIKDTLVRITYQIDPVKDYQSYFLTTLPELQVKIFSYLSEKKISHLLRDNEFPSKIDNIDIYVLIFTEKYPQFKDLYFLYQKGKFEFTFKYIIHIFEINNPNAIIENIEKCIQIPDLNISTIDLGFENLFYEFILRKGFPQESSNFVFEDIINCKNVYIILIQSKEKLPILTTKLKTMESWDFSEIRKLFEQIEPVYIEDSYILYLLIDHINYSDILEKKGILENIPSYSYKSKYKKLKASTLQLIKN